MDPTRSYAGSNVIGHIRFEDRAVLDHHVLAHLDVNACSGLVNQWTHGWTGGIGGDARVVQENATASNEDGAAAITAGIDDRLLGDLDRPKRSKGLTIDIGCLVQRS